jgi:hypothetical protein
MDIAISAVLAILTILMGYLGVHVTLHPAESPSTARRYKIAFVFCAILTVCLVVWQGVRNSQTQSQLRQELVQIDQNTRTPPRVDVNVPAPQVNVQLPPAAQVQKTGDRPILQILNEAPSSRALTPGTPLGMNVVIHNEGPVPAKGVKDLSIIDTIAGPPSEEKEEAFFKKLAAEEQEPDFRKKPGTGLGLHSGFFSTFYTEELTAQQINALKTGDLLIYLVSKVDYQDLTGNHFETEACAFYWGNQPTVWHVCRTHNSIK